MKPSDVTHIIVHCSDSRWGDVEEITRWHRARGFDTIGYHYVITNAHPRGSRVADPTSDGVVHNGRSPSRAGAHCLGYNSRSIGICLVGKRHFTAKQMRSLRRVVQELQRRYGVPTANVLGHYETPRSHGKTCPNFDVAAFRETL